ncbi:MAG: flagellin FliC [Deltaproteobacteria bacterium]|nr:flagellin FliC [Deltaproteobacteria bacterium]
MAISLVTNVETVAVLRNLDKTQRGLSSNIGRLSSGLRINKAGDDAAGLAISETLKAQIRGLAQAQRNAQDGVSMIQVAEGALNEIHGALSRMRELAVQSANATQDDTTRGYLNNEFQALVSEIDRIGNVTDFNGRKLLNTTASFAFQVGVFACTAENQISVTVDDVNVSSIGTTTYRIGSTSISHASGTDSGALGSLESIDAAIQDVSTARASIGAAQNRLVIAIDNVASQRENLMASNSRIRDVDISYETSEFTRNQILNQAGVSVLAQANQLPQVGLSLLRG